MSNKNGKNSKDSKRSVSEIAGNDQISSEEHEITHSGIHTVTPAKKSKQVYDQNNFNFEETAESRSHLESLYNVHKTIQNNTPSNNLVDKKGMMTEINAAQLVAFLEKGSH